MTEESIKEEISYNFLGLLASRAGFLCGPPPKDYGVDLQLSKVGVFLDNGKRRYADTGQQIQLQVKSTCENSIVRTDDVLKFDLEAKTFNDLVRRRNSGGTPMYLIVFILPDDQAKWISVYSKGIITRKTAYWYRPDPGEEFTSNQVTKRIAIDQTCIVDVDIIRQWFVEQYE